MTAAEKQVEPRVEDLVEVPEIRTVIQLEDLKDPRLSRMLMESFVLTQEVSDNLKAVLESLCRKEGRGILLKGHFGSGKSHFLSLLSLLVKRPETWRFILEQEPGLEELRQRISGRPPLLAVEVSLVRHRAAEYLEDIVVGALADGLGERLAEKPVTRHAAFDRLSRRLREEGYGGVVVLVDELSEFLRSKADARQFNEDIRFLQYLGEEGRSVPLWVIATLQEWIEETGEIHQETFNKIKDRYPVRLSLGRAHIEELVSERLIRHKPGAEARIRDLFENLRGYFPTFPVAGDRFARLYPVHPATSFLLDRLRMLFSEHRGIVDFIHYRLKGDPERRIAAWLDRPARDLLTPDIIFDHFLDRLRESSETQLYVARVYESYAEEIPVLFQDPDQQKVALAAVKLLVLFAVSPVKFRYTVRHMAEMLLFPVTPLDSEVNYRFVQDILDRMCAQGEYIRVEAADDSLDNRYFIDVKPDLRAIVRRRIRHGAAQLYSEDRRLFSKLAPLVDAPHLPLSTWVEREHTTVSLTWQHTRRRGWLMVGRLEELGVETLGALAEKWAWVEEDFFLFLGTTSFPEKQVEHVDKALLPYLRERHPGMFLFWIPASLEGAEDRLKQILAALLLRESADLKRSEQAKQTAEFLEKHLEHEKAWLVEAYTRAYFNGRLLWDAGRVDLSSFGYLSPEKFLAEFSPPLLERRFPLHGRIHPYMDPLAPGILMDLLRGFLASGVLRPEATARHGLLEVIEGILRPMGLVKKRGRQYELQVNPKQSELARRFLEEMGQRPSVPLDEMYWRLRKGEYGLLRPHFEILVLAMLFTGNLVAYKGTARRSPEEISHSGLKGVTSLGRGEVLSDTFRQVLSVHPLVPGKYKDAPLSLSLQEALWSALRAEKPGALEALEALHSRAKWAMAFGAFKAFPWDGLIEAIERVGDQWNEIKVSYGSREGLERFLSAAQQEPFLEEKIQRIREAEGFLEQADRALFAYQYLTHPKLELPGGSEYRALREAHAAALSGFRKPNRGVSPAAMEEILGAFRRFQEAYAATYEREHQRARGGGQFEAYEKVSRSRRYALLRRMDRLEMISVEHDRRSVDQMLSRVLLRRCSRSPRDSLQGDPLCVCGFRLGEKIDLPPVKEIERAIDQGIGEALKAFKSPPVQERLVPYLEGLRQVGKGTEAAEVHRLLELGEAAEDRILELEQVLSARVIGHVNEAFRGRVVVVKRDLDRLYKSLAHRKYTLAQTRKILRDWLDDESLTEETFLHFLSRKGGTEIDLALGRGEDFLERQAESLKPLREEIGGEPLLRAVLVALWGAQYALEAERIVGLLPLLNRGGTAENERVVGELAMLGRRMRRERPEDVERLAMALEADPSMMQGLWATLSDLSPEEIFQRERIFPALLREAFERIMAGGGNADRLVLSDPAREEPEGRTRERKQEMVEALELRDRLQEETSSLAAPEVSPEEGPLRWESAYTRHLGRLPWLRDRLLDRLARIGIPVPASLARDIRAMERRMGVLHEQFQRYYRQALPLWEAEAGVRPAMIEDIPGMLSRKRRVPIHGSVRYILMDGVRWDLWEHIKAGFFAPRSNHFRIAREGVIWSGRPTTTGSQMQHFEEAFARAGLEGEGAAVWKMTGIDEKIHAEKGPLTHLFANALSYLEIEWLHRLVDLPPRTLLFLFSDHGFVENPAFDPADKLALPRYIHGGDTPFEVIVPWAWVLRL